MQRFIPLPADKKIDTDKAIHTCLIDGTLRQVKVKASVFGTRVIVERQVRESEKYSCHLNLSTADAVRLAEAIQTAVGLLRK